MDRREGVEGERERARAAVHGHLCFARYVFVNVSVYGQRCACRRIFLTGFNYLTHLIIFLHSETSYDNNFLFYFFNLMKSPNLSLGITSSFILLSQVELPCQIYFKENKILALLVARKGKRI